MIPHDLHHFFVGQHVFVTGASGFIGSHVASLLVQAGAHVRALTRSTKGGYDSAIDWVEGDLFARDSIDAAMKDSRYVFQVDPTLATVRHVFMRRIGSAFLPLAPAKLPGGFGRTGLRL